ncbi:rhomboid family intramembrane serine protease [Pseudomonas sp. nanlin1]|uniref:rhomboid family intramembrane serine protease n=1 Tax=Pseudomonas sp. nanlin1 TaxID=3040605 RepID=UPI00388FE2B3
MSKLEVFRQPLSIDLSGFVGLLRRLQVPHRVTEEGDAQVLWIDPRWSADSVRELYQRYPDGNAEVDTSALPALAPAARPSLLAQARSNPVTAVVLLLSVVVAALTWLGEDLAHLRWLTFLDFHVEGEYIYFDSLASSLAGGQWWRLITPMLVHFGILHLAMNGLWYWELGRRIEQRQGHLSLVGLTLIFSLVSNYAQYAVGGPSLFGGLSGVLYGLLGHCWLYQWLAPNAHYHLPRGVLVMMLVWLLVCMSGVVGALGFGEIANAAHVGGLLAGCLTGLLGGALARRRLSR